MLEKHRFQSYTDEEDRGKGDLVFSVKLKDEEKELLKKMKKIINQPKNSTAIKTLAWFGAKVILEDKNMYLIEQILGNKRKNERIGVLVE